MAASGRMWRRRTAGSAIRAPSLYAPACPLPDCPLSLAERRTASVPLLVRVGAVGRPARLPRRRQFPSMERGFCLHFLCYSTVLYRLPGGCGLQRR
jgi:hypothetical protein